METNREDLVVSGRVERLHARWDGARWGWSESDSNGGVGLVTIWTKFVPKSSGVGVIRGSKRLEPVPGAVSETRKSE